MPCICWTTPSEPSKRLIKGCCEMIINEIKIMEEGGDLDSFGLNHVHKLLDHLYRPDKCDEKPYGR